MKELDFLTSALDKATQKGAFNLSETSGIVNSLQSVSTHISKLESKAEALIKENTQLLDEVTEFRKREGSAKMQPVVKEEPDGKARKGSK